MITEDLFNLFPEIHGESFHLFYCWQQKTKRQEVNLFRGLNNCVVPKINKNSPKIN